MSWISRCNYCRTPMGNLYRPRMVWQDFDDSLHDCRKASDGEHDFGPWISDGKTPIKDFLTAWNYPNRAKLETPRGRET